MNLPENYQQVMAEFDKYKEAIKGTPIEPYTGLLGYHIQQIELHAQQCDYSGLFQHLRELGEERPEDALDEAVEAGTMTEDQMFELNEKGADMLSAIDDFAANLLNIQCSCKLK